MKKTITGTALLACAMTASVCLAAPQDDLSRVRGQIRIDGSSTVYPITEAVAEQFSDAAPNVRVTVGISGTGGGFKRFAAGETDISDASRPIKASEHAQTIESNVEYIEIPVAYDGLSIVVNQSNDFIDYLTVDELKKIFLEKHAAKTWRDVRPAWPATKMNIYAPGTDSGTFDYFKEVVAGDDDAIRSDMSVSEDDNVLVRGVSGDPAAIGFFGYAYYEENQDSLKVVPIINPETNKAITPSPETIEDGSYAPFSRPLFIYVSARSAVRPHVKAFVNYYLKHGPELAGKVGYVRLPQSVYDRAAANFASGKTGTHYLDADGNKVEGPVTKVFLK